MAKKENPKKQIERAEKAYNEFLSKMDILRQKQKGLMRSVINKIEKRKIEQEQKSIKHS